VQRQVPGGPVVGGVDEHQIDVGAEVELLRPVLAHGDGRQTRRAALAPASRGSVGPAEPLHDKGDRLVEAQVGQHRQLEADLL